LWHEVMSFQYWAGRKQTTVSRQFSVTSVEKL